MSEHQFNMRLNCRYSGTDNHIEALVAEHLIDGAWQVFDLNLLTPGFSIYVYSLFTCQHTYFRVNCADSGLQLASSEGSLELVAAEDWMLQRIHVAFTGHLSAGEASPDLVDYVIERMGHCPVSRNTKDAADSQTSVRFISS